MGLRTFGAAYAMPMLPRALEGGTSLYAGDAVTAGLEAPPVRILVRNARPRVHVEGQVEKK